jgi:O-antigen/teichoic acid export membrane protein
MAVSFVATPYILHFLGAERLGAFRTAQQWTGYLSYLYFGLGPAVMVFLLRPASRGDLAGVSAIARLGLRLEFRQTLVLVAPVAVVMAWFMPLLVPVDTSLRAELKIGALIYAASVLFAPAEIFRLLLECLQCGYLVNGALLVQSLIAIGCSVWFAWCGYGIGGQFLALLLGVAGSSILVAGFGLSRLLGFDRSKPALIPRGDLWSLRWPMTITGIGGQINLLTDYVVVGLTINAASVTTFSITQRLVSVLGGFITALTGATWAGLAEVLASGDRSIFEERILELVRLVLGLGLTILGTLAAYNFHFVRLWVGPRYYGGDLLTVLTAAQTLILAFFLLFTWTIDSQGDARYRVPVTSFGAALNLTLSFLLSRWIGMYGVTLATIVGYLLTEAWFCPYLFCRRYKVSFRAIVGATFRTLCLGVPWLVLVWFVAHAHRSLSSWSDFGVELTGMILLGTLYTWILILTPADRTLWRKRCKRVIHVAKTHGDA